MNVSAYFLIIVPSFGVLVAILVAFLNGPKDGRNIMVEVLLKVITVILIIIIVSTTAIFLRDLFLDINNESNVTNVNDTESISETSQTVNTSTHFVSGVEDDSVVDSTVELTSSTYPISKMVDEKWGFVDQYGNEVIPFIYEYADSFSEGLAAVRKGVHWGYINEDGVVVIPFNYDGASSFVDGIAPVYKDGLWGFIDKEENVVIPYQYENIVTVTENDKVIYYDENDELIAY